MQLVYRSGVAWWELDQNGHLNVEHYAKRAEGGLASLAHALGLGPRALAERSWALNPREQHLRFLREQFYAAPISIYAGVLEHAEGGLRVYEEFRHTGTGEPIAAFTFTLGIADARTRQPLPIPDDARKRAADLRVDLPDHARPRGVQTAVPRKPPTIAEAEGLGMVQTYQDVLQSGYCDGDGFLRPSRYLGIINDCSVNYSIIKEIPSRREQGRAGAILEYRWVFHETPRAGDVLVNYAALSAVGSKTNCMVNWLFNLETGEPTALSEFLSVQFDVDTRKSVDYSPEHRARLESQKIPNLSV